MTRVLAVPPCAGLGLISYGLYLYHWPIFLFLTPDRTGLSGNALLALRLGATLGVSLVSYYTLEMPVRKGVLKRIRPVALTGAAVVATLLIVLVAGVGPSGTDAAASGGLDGTRRGRAGGRGAR